MIAVLRRFHAGIKEALHALEIGLVAPKTRLRLIELRALRGQRRLRLLQRRARLVVRPREVVIRFVDLRLEARHVGFRRIQARFEFLRIELRDQLALLHFRSFVHGQIHDPPHDLRAHDHFVPVDDPRQRNRAPARRRQQIRHERDHKNRPDQNERLEVRLHRAFSPCIASPCSRKSSSARFRAATASGASKSRPATRPSITAAAKYDVVICIVSIAI